MGRARDGKPSAAAYSGAQFVKAFCWAQSLQLLMSWGLPAGFAILASTAQCVVPRRLSRNHGRTQALPFSNRKTKAWQLPAFPGHP